MHHEELARRTSQDTAGDVSRVLAKLEETGQDKTILKVLANHPDVFRPFVLMANALVYRAALPPEVREAAVLWIARHQGQTYEWAEHVPMARDAGLSGGQISDIRSGIRTSLSEGQCLAILAAEELLTTRSWKDETWKSLTARWGNEGALELALVLGWWGGLVPLVLDALGLKFPDRLPDDTLVTLEP